MSYIGQAALKNSELKVFNVTSSTSATHTLSWTAPNEQSLFVTINGVKQQEDAYSINGSPTVVTLTDALVATDKMEVVGVLDIGQVTIVGDNTVSTSALGDSSVSTAKIVDDAVTTDKLANSINTEITANTAKVTNATHTGDVTGATALTIANNAVNLAKLEDGTQGDILYYGASGAPTRLGVGTTGQFLKTLGASANPAWATVEASGLNSPYVMCTTNNDNATWGNASYTQVEFDTIVTESHNGSFDTTDWEWTVPAGESGTYSISMFLSIPGSIGGHYHKFRIDGSDGDIGDDGTDGFYYALTSQGNSQMSTTWVVKLAAGEVLDWFLYGVAASGSAGNCAVSIWRIW